MRRTADVTALVFGLIVTTIAGGVLWRTFIGDLNWSLVKVAAPLGLVLIGVVGLLLSRRT
jgi:hypothetical protein